MLSDTMALKHGLSRRGWVVICLASLTVAAAFGLRFLQRPNVVLDGRPVIVCLGDSLTAGNTAPADQSYPAWLQRRLDGAGYRYQVVNAGVSGDRVADGLARLRHDVLDLHPAIVIVDLGSNDPGHTPRDQWAAGLATIVQFIQRAHSRVILGGLDEPGMAEVYRAISTRFRVPLVWLTSGLWSRPGLWGDAHHPNGAGYHVVADTIWPALVPLLSTPRR